MKNKLYISSILIFVFLGLMACKKTPEITDVSSKLELASLKTKIPDSITTSYAISGGEITYDGNSEISARGVCWNTSEDPTLENNLGYTSDGIGTGSFTSSLSGLDENTTYYIVAYATNSKGTAYGDEFSFTTLVFGECGDIIFYEGQNYNTVLIGIQCWMKENLNIGTKINGSQEMQNNTAIEKYCYEDNEANCDTYGGLYQWDEMMQYNTQEGVQGICPNGWHIPTDNEWKQLEMYLGMSQSEADDTGWRGNDEGKKLKSSSSWNDNGNGSNSSGFTALPGGRYYYGSSFGNLGHFGSWWSSTENLGADAWPRGLYYDYNQVHRNNHYKTHGFSVRCIKD